MMLHIIRHSYFESESLKNCLAVHAPQDGLLLIENGVFCALSGTQSGKQLINLANQQLVFILMPHAVERGVENRLIDNIQLINFSEFVDLTINPALIFQW